MEIKDLHKIFLECSKVNTDSRTIKQGDLFFALKGENFDGNKFAEQALIDGAKYAVVDNESYGHGQNMILVQDSLTALQELAKFHRQQLDIPVLACTGSNGKTTTKELIHSVLSKKYNCLATVGNFNNHIGVPLTLLKINNKHDFAIVEMGANHTKEIALLCEIARPNYGLITNIGKAHIGEFGGFNKIIEAKLELYDSIAIDKGTLFVNASDSLLMESSVKIDRQLYGTSQQANFSGTFLSNTPFVSIEFGDSVTVNSKIIGKYNFDNMMAAISIGSYFQVPDFDIKAALESYIPTNNRSQIIKTENNTLIMDAYNANPSSVEVAIENIRSMEGKDKFFILGDMLELGEESPAEHEAIRQLATEHIGAGVFVGEEFNSVFKDDPCISSFLNTEAALQHLKANPIQGKLILIKGSRGMKLEVLQEAL